MATSNASLNRRRFLGSTIGLASLLASGGWASRRDSEGGGLVAEIERQVIFPGRRGRRPRRGADDLAVDRRVRRLRPGPLDDLPGPGPLLDRSAADPRPGA